MLVRAVVIVFGLGLSLFCGCGDDAGGTAGSGTEGTTDNASVTTVTETTAPSVTSGSGETSGGTSGTATDSSSTTESDTSGTHADGLGWTFEAQRLGGSATDEELLEGGVVSGSLRWIAGQPRETISAGAGAGFITVADASSVDFGDESFRIDLTVRTAYHGTEGDAGRGVIVSRGAADDRGFALLVRDGQLGWRVWSDGSASEVWSTIRFSDDRWHQVNAIRDRDTLELVLVIDGYDVVRAADDAGDISSSEPLFVLGTVTGDRFFGSLDALALTPGRVDAPEPTPEWDDRPVFVAGEDAAEGTDYAGFRIPSIVRTDDGTLVAFAEGRVDATCDFGEIHVVSKRSTDGGETWSPLARVATAGSGKAGNPIPVADGDRIALMVLETPCESGSGCTCQGAQRHAVYLSDDAGQSWSPRTEVTQDVTVEGWGGVLLGPGSGIRLERGPNAGTLVITAKHGGNSHLLTSDDHGATWSIAAQESTSPLGVNETTVAELSDGRLLVNARYQRSTDQEEMEQDLGFRLLGHVNTDWTYPDDPTFARTAEFRGPVVHGAMLYHRGSDRYGDEARLLFSYPAGQYGTPAGRRHDMRVYVSRDDGQTWARSRRIVGGWAAYSDLVELADGRVGMLYEGGQQLGPNLNAYERLHLVRTRPEWLDHGSLATYSFEDAAGDPRPTTLADAGGFSLPLQTFGAVTTVVGQHHSTALHFEGNERACATPPPDSTRNTFDFGRRDSFAIEVTFRTDAHTAGGATAAGALVSKTAVGTTPAWWLRVEDGQIRFLMSQCPGERINCGLLPGACASLTSCENAGVQGGNVADGQWHSVRIVRDAIAEELRLEIDGELVQTSPANIHGIVVNDEPLCVGAFNGGSRGFVGDVDHVRVELLD